VTTWPEHAIQMQSRVIDGLTVRFAQSENRDDHALLLSPWPESLLAWPVWTRLAEHAHLVAESTCPGSVIPSRDDALLSPRAMAISSSCAPPTPSGSGPPARHRPGIGTAASLFAAAASRAGYAAWSSAAAAAAVPLTAGRPAEGLGRSPDLDSSATLTAQIVTKRAV